MRNNHAEPPVKESPAAINLNGRRQIIDLLRVMQIEEKNRLFHLIKQKNPKFADDLASEGIFFDPFLKLPASQLLFFFEEVKPQVLGAALRSASAHVQRFFLRSAENSYAEIAFESMTAPQGKDSIKGAKAQEVVAQTALRLFGRHFFQTL